MARASGVENQSATLRFTARRGVASSTRRFPCRAHAFYLLHHHTVSPTYARWQAHITREGRKAARQRRHLAIRKEESARSTLTREMVYQSAWKGGATRITRV